MEHLGRSTVNTRLFRGLQGIKIAVDERGSPGAPQVLLLHGGGQTRHSWGAALQTLAERGFHTLSMDLRGHGDSGWSETADYSLDAHVGDLRAIIATLDRPTLVGASMGGLASLLAAGEFPLAPVSALVLVDVVPRIEAAGASEVHAFMAAHQNGFATLEEAAQTVSKYLPHRIRPANPAGLMKNLREFNGRLHWHWDPRMIRESTTNPLVLQHRLEAAAQRVQIPALLIRGGLSRLVSMEGVKAFRELMPQAEFANVEYADHMVAGDRNDAFNAPLIDFLERHRL